MSVEIGPWSPNAYGPRVLRLGVIGRVALVRVRESRVGRVSAVSRQAVSTVGQRRRDERSVVGCDQRSADDRAGSGRRRGGWRGRSECQEGEKADLRQCPMINNTNNIKYM